MKTLALLVATFVTLAGCRSLTEVDTTAPAAPRGIRTVSLDDAVYVQWLANTEPDLAAYNIWSSNAYDGQYTLVATTTATSFEDLRPRNGVTVYYALSAFDNEGNESDLSADVVYDTPRPEGSNVLLNNYLTQPSTAGYDFSTYSVGLYNDEFTDVFFESVNGRYYLDVFDDTEIQDMGYTESLDEISVAPVNGWSPSRSVEAIPGHTYEVWTWDDHYAKVQVTETSAIRVHFDWAYQTAPGNTELRVAKPAPRRRAPLQRASVAQN